MGGFGDKASSAGHSAWDSMLPELEGVDGEEAWRLREILSFAVAADQVDAPRSHLRGLASGRNMG